METLGERLQEARLRVRPRLKQSDLAALVGLSRGQIANYETGRTDPPREMLYKLAGALNVSVDYLIGVESPKVVNVREERVPYAPEIRLIPYWGEVPCGSWEAPPDDPGWIQVSEAFQDTGIVGVRVSGNSMMPRLTHGQLAIVKLDKTPREGVVTLAHNEQGELTLKVLRMRDGSWHLDSLNPEYPEAAADKWTILGFVIGMEERDPAGLRP